MFGRIPDVDTDDVDRRVDRLRPAPARAAAKRPDFEHQSVRRYQARQSLEDLQLGLRHPAGDVQIVRHELPIWASIVKDYIIEELKR
jgi:hypothetical protein